MILWRWRKLSLLSLLFLLVMLLVACGGSTAQTTKPTPTPVPPTPTPGPGQQILNTAANKLNTAKTLHGIFNLTLLARNFNGTIDSELWNAQPNKNRTLVTQSTLDQFSETGSITVTDGKQVWQYEPRKRVVYSGPVATNSAGTTNGGGFAGSGGGQSQFLLTIVQTVFTRSNATLRPDSAAVNGHTVYDIHVVPQDQTTSSGVGSFNYDGNVFIDKSTQLPVQVKLNIQGLGNVQLDIPKLELNINLSDSTFVFVVPAGVKVLPLQAATATPGSGSLSLAQAQQQAGYHLLSIPGEQTDYVLLGVNALGTPGNQTYTLNYMKGNTSFTIAQGKSLANLPGSGQSISIRNTTAYLSTSASTTTLAWTENGVGILITGKLSSAQIQAIATLLT